MHKLFCIGLLFTVQPLSAAAPPGVLSKSTIYKASQMPTHISMKSLALDACNKPAIFAKSDKLLLLRYAIHDLHSFVEKRRKFALQHAYWMFISHKKEIATKFDFVFDQARAELEVVALMRKNMEAVCAGLAQQDLATVGKFMNLVLQLIEDNYLFKVDETSIATLFKPSPPPAPVILAPKPSRCIRIASCLVT